MIKDNEKVYDEQISPLMEQIIKICQENEIPMLCTFQYGPESEEGSVPFCTTLLVGFEGTDEAIKNAYRALNKPTGMLAMTFTTTEE